MNGNGGSGRSAQGGPGGSGKPDGSSGPFGNGVSGGAGWPDGNGGQWVVPGYTHERELGSGASGLVVLARHDPTGTPVAIKYLAGPLGRDDRFREAFRGEAHLLGGLDSPYIARFYEYVEDGPGAAIVMELVDGIALRTLLRQEGATDPEPALTVLKGSLLGLAAAHAAGVIHRDYKPANVLVTTDGLSKLVDFGVAVRSGETGGVAGTPSYMAPEQWAGGPATPATDVYAATATFFECLTGSKPYSGSTMFELAVQHAEAPIPNEQVPEPVRSLVRRGLAKTPEERPQSAAEFVVELQAVASAAYGEDWEERGQRKLAALVALLPLLLPSAAGGASGSTDLAYTRLGPDPSGAALGGAAAGASHPHGRVRRPRIGRRGRLVAGAVLAVLVTAGLAMTAVATIGGTPDAQEVAASTPSALTSLTTGPPVDPAVAPSASTSASTSAAASASASASATTSGAPTGTPTTGAPTTPATGGPTATGTSTGGGPTATATTTAPPPTPAPTLHISLVTAQLACDGRNGVSASVTIRSDGAAAGTLALSWFHTDANGATTVVATDSAQLPAGRSSFTGTYTHVFGGRDISAAWGLTVATDPAAGTGQNSSRTLSPSTCRPVVIG